MPSCRSSQIQRSTRASHGTYHPWTTRQISHEGSPGLKEGRLSRSKQSSSSRLTSHPSARCSLQKRLIDRSRGGNCFGQNSWSKKATTGKIHMFSPMIEGRWLNTWMKPRFILQNVNFVKIPQLIGSSLKMVYFEGRPSSWRFPCW